MTLEEINHALVTDQRPSGPDGCSNTDRLRFIVSALQVSSIDLTVEYDFSLIAEESDPVYIAALKHLVLLQFDYIGRLVDHGYMTLDDYETNAAKISMSVRRIDHHLGYLEDGLPTPPFPVFG